MSNYEDQGTGCDPGAAGHELQGRASTPVSGVARARGILEHCATNQAAHFGGPHGMFVDVPVDALVALLNAHKAATE